MKVNTNKWNVIRYSIYLPIYDLMAGIFSRQRKQSIALLGVDADAKVLILGAGTGLDLPYLKKYKNLYAIDITPGMIGRLEQRAKRLGVKVDARVMDGQALDFPDAYFDAVVMHLILAVIPDPYKCIKEVERVLKPGGEVVVFDKFLEKEQKASCFRKFLNKITNFLFSDITRNITVIMDTVSLKLEYRQTVFFKNAFKICKYIKA